MNNWSKNKLDSSALCTGACLLCNKCATIIKQCAGINDKKWNLEGYVDCPIHINCENLLKITCDKCRYDCFFKGEFQAANTLQYTPEQQEMIDYLNSYFEIDKTVLNKYIEIINKYKNI